MTKRGWRPKKPSPTDWDQVRENAARFDALVKREAEGVERHGPYSPSNHTQNALYREHAKALAKPRKRKGAPSRTAYAPISRDQEKKGPWIVATSPSAHQIARARRWLRANDRSRVEAPNHIANTIEAARL